MCLLLQQHGHFGQAPEKDLAIQYSVCTQMADMLTLS
jgi:hypothetical protein